MPLLRAKVEDSENEADSFDDQNPFTVAHIASIYASPFAQGFSNDQCQAAIRVLLKHGAHKDGAHYHTKSPGGLHPAYAGFNPVDKSEQKVLSRTALVEASLCDVFDAVSSISSSHPS